MKNNTNLKNLFRLIGIDCMVLAGVFAIIMIAIVVSAKQFFAPLIAVTLAFIILGVISFIVMAFFAKKAKTTEVAKAVVAEDTTSTEETK